MITYSDTYSITDLRQKTLEVLAAAKHHGYVSLIKNSKKASVVVDPDIFLKLQEVYDNYLDNLEYDKGMADLKKHKPVSLHSILK